MERVHYSAQLARRTRAMVADMHDIELPPHADFTDRFSQALCLTADVGG